MIYDTNNQTPYLSVVIPIYNEAPNITDLHERLTVALQALDYPYELIAVDDGSRDGSFELLRELAQTDQHLTAIRFRRNFGQTAAFSAGFAQARGEVIVTIDADLQNDPADIGMLVDKLREGYDVVSGWRKQRHDAFLSRRLPSVVANAIISRITGVALHDYGCSLKAYRASVLHNIRLYGELHRFIPAIASWQGVAVAELPVNHAARQRGASKYGIGRLPRVILDIITVRFLLSYSTRPMQLFGGLGVVLAGFGVLIGAYLSVLKIVYALPIADRPLLIVAVTLVLIGIQLIGFGLLAEMLTRTYHEAQAKPIYAVQEDVNS